MKYAVAGRIGLRLMYLESLPERNVLHGTMGDYGFTPRIDAALLFESESRALWHAARAYGFDGHRGTVIPIKEVV